MFWMNKPGLLCIVDEERMPTKCVGKVNYIVVIAN